MPTPDQMKDTVKRYTAAHSAKDIDGVMAEFAADALVVDPVDQPAYRGHDAIRAFFAGTHEMTDSMELRMTGPVRAVGNWAAAPLQAVSTMGEAKVAVDIIDVFTFGEDGLVTEMRAYWSASDIRPVD